MRLNVLMSTWNGQRFLREQLDSILAQTGIDLALTVRDDGSSDSTMAILRQYESQGAPITIHTGPNLGPANSYLELLRIAAPADLYAFSDQDDVWDLDHLAQAARRLGTLDSTVPALYCSRLRYIGGAGEARGTSRIPRVLDLRNALAENVAIGCTQVFNEEARQLVNRCRPAHVVMHDAWLYLVVAAFGAIVYDDVPRVAYRLHGANAFGARANPFANGLLHFRRMLRQGGFGFHEQARSLLDCYDPPHRELVAAYALDRGTLMRRIRCAIRAPIVRRSRVHGLLFRCLIVLNLD